MGKRKTQFTKHDYSKPYGKLIKIHQNKIFKICPQNNGWLFKF